MNGPLITKEEKEAAIKAINEAYGNLEKERLRFLLDQLAEIRKDKSKARPTEKKKKIFKEALKEICDPYKVAQMRRFWGI